MKPILFNTEMVQAILDGRKTITRRLVKPQPKFLEGETGTPMICDDGETWTFKIDQYKCTYDSDRKAPCCEGDILYVRETWQYAYDCDGNENIDYESGRYLYAADNPEPFNRWLMPDGTYRDSMPWRPSIHMPKEAARIFLRVKNVRLEKLQEITPEEAVAEGAVKNPHYMRYGGEKCLAIHGRYVAAFMALWNTTIKKEDLPTYGWDANPYVWVIEFEKISKEEATKC